MVDGYVLFQGLLDALSRILKAFFFFCKMNSMKKTAILLSVALFIQSCTEPDNTSPVIEMMGLSPTPAPGLVCGEMEDNVIALSSADTLEVTFRLTDDKELSQYKIDLHNNFDCHGHSGKTETTDWYMISIEDVVGSEQTITRKLPVPIDVTTGMYHFSIQATDAAGNNAQSTFYALNVTNADDIEAPVLTTSVPASSNFSVQKGTSVSFEGTLTDNNPLGAGTNGRLELRYWKTSSQTVNTLYEEDVDSAIAETYNFNFDADVPATVADGTYIFELRAFDAVNNPSNTVQFTVEIF